MELWLALNSKESLKISKFARNGTIDQKFCLNDGSNDKISFDWLAA
jgi:hypothetical protein